MAGWLAFVGKLACWLSCFSPPRTDVILDTHTYICVHTFSCSQSCQMAVYTRFAAFRSRRRKSLTWMQKYKMPDNRFVVMKSWRLVNSHTCLNALFFATCSVAIPEVLERTGSTHMWGNMSHMCASMYEDLRLCLFHAICNLSTSKRLLAVILIAPSFSHHPAA